MGHRERGRAHRGQHLPGRADLRPAAVQPAGAGLRAVPHADARPVPVRLQHPSGRRRHGRAGRQRRARACCATCASRGRHEHRGWRAHGLRCHRHRRRAQRPRLRALPRTRRPQGAGAGGRGERRRGGRDARVRAGLPRLGRRAPAAPDAGVRSSPSSGSKRHGLRWAAQAMPTMALGTGVRAASSWTAETASPGRDSGRTLQPHPRIHALLRRASPRRSIPLLASAPPRLGGEPLARPPAPAARWAGACAGSAGATCASCCASVGMNAYDLLEDDFEYAAAAGRARPRCRARHELRPALARHRPDLAVPARGAARRRRPRLSRCPSAGSAR